MLFGRSASSSINNANEVTKSSISKIQKVLLPVGEGFRMRADWNDYKIGNICLFINQIKEGFAKPEILFNPECVRGEFETGVPIFRDEDFKFTKMQILGKRSVLQSSLISEWFFHNALNVGNLNLMVNDTKRPPGIPPKSVVMRRFFILQSSIFRRFK